jgi:hypothetical protein
MFARQIWSGIGGECRPRSRAGARRRRPSGTRAPVRSRRSSGSHARSARAGGRGRQRDRRASRPARRNAGVARATGPREAGRVVGCVEAPGLVRPDVVAVGPCAPFAVLPTSAATRLLPRDRRLERARAQLAVEREGVPLFDRGIRNAPAARGKSCPDVSGTAQILGALRVLGAIRSRARLTGWTRSLLSRR